VEEKVALGKHVCFYLAFRITWKAVTSIIRGGRKIGQKARSLAHHEFGYSEVASI